MVSGRIVKHDENQSNTIQGTKTEMEQKQFIKDETITINLRIHKNRVDRRESENNLGYGFLISPHKDVYPFEVYQLTTYEVVIQGIDSLLWKSAISSEMDSM